MDVIAKVMNGSHNFLEQRHTVRYLRAGEVQYTRLAERRSWGEWDRTGRQGLAERAQAEAERLLAAHEVQPLTGEQERELDAIMQQATEELVPA